MSAECHMHVNEASPDDIPKVLSPHQGCEEGSLCLLGGDLQLLTSASQKGRDTPEAHVPSYVATQANKRWTPVAWMMYTA
jgi:hypothetical protein